MPRMLKGMSAYGDRRNGWDLDNGEAEVGLGTEAAEMPGLKGYLESHAVDEVVVDVKGLD